MVLPVRDWMGDVEATYAALPADVQAALGRSVAPADRAEHGGPSRLLVEIADASQSDQFWHGDNKLVQAKPIPNLQGKWADGEMVFRFPTAAQAEVMYSTALVWLLPGQVELTIMPDEGQYAVHVMPAVLRDQHAVVKLLTALSKDLLDA
jgi:uncharacterized protein (DUF1684 family)